MGYDSDIKSQMVLEICSLSTSTIACAHRRPIPCTPVKSRFIDWYRILGVDENADTQVIKKRYHKLALQLHPDKNKHPKAEIAFKLVLEAYSCLSNNVKRETFNLERWKNFCIECNRIPYAPCSPKLKKWNPASRSRSQQIQSLRDIREKIKEETKVIENCLRPSRRESPLFNPSNHILENNTCRRSQKEFPVFNPSDYLFEGYPHVRSRTYKKRGNFCHWQGKNIFDYDRDSPVFENRSGRGMCKGKSACVHS